MKCQSIGKTFPTSKSIGTPWQSTRRVPIDYKITKSNTLITCNGFISKPIYLGMLIYYI